MQTNDGVALFICECHNCNYICPNAIAKYTIVIQEYDIILSGNGTE